VFYHDGLDQPPRLPTVGFATHGATPPVGFASLGKNPVDIHLTLLQAGLPTNGVLRSKPFSDVLDILAPWGRAFFACLPRGFASAGILSHTSPYAIEMHNLVLAGIGYPELSKSRVRTPRACYAWGCSIRASHKGNYSVCFKLTKF
jgi:hypothetical protein